MNTQVHGKLTENICLTILLYNFYTLHTAIVNEPHLQIPDTHTHTLLIIAALQIFHTVNVVTKAFHFFFSCILLAQVRGTELSEIIWTRI